MRGVLRLTVLALGAITAVSIHAVTVPTSGNTALSNDQDKLSYALGVETGRSFKAHDVQVNPQIFAQGIQDGLQDKPTLLTNEQVQKVISNFQQQTLAKMQSQLKESADKNQKAETQFLADNKSKSGVVETSSGLQYKVVTPGKGTNPADNDEVTVEYEGKLLNGQVFDSTYQRGKPANFPVNAVIPGWQEALKLMQPGAVYELYIPSKLAYGDQGAGGVIGPNELLVFKVHLISVKPGAGNAAQPQAAGGNS